MHNSEISNYYVALYIYKTDCFVNKLKKNSNNDTYIYYFLEKIILFDTFIEKITWNQTWLICTQLKRKKPFILFN